MAVGKRQRTADDPADDALLPGDGGNDDASEEALVEVVAEVVAEVAAVGASAVRSIVTAAEEVETALVEATAPSPPRRRLGHGTRRVVVLMPVSLGGGATEVGVVRTGRQHDGT